MTFSFRRDGYPGFRWRDFFSIFSGKRSTRNKKNSSFRSLYLHRLLDLRPDSTGQLRHVMSASFYKKKIMSKAEYKVFKVVENAIQAERNGCRVLSQTSLGEIIGSNDKNAFSAINSKRVDILIIGPYGDPIAAIEHQGAGHHQGEAAARDAIKREALRKAGVHFIEVLDNHSATEIAQLIRRIFQIPPPA